jgi:hypothetical protein
VSTPAAAWKYGLASLRVSGEPEEKARLGVKPDGGAYSSDACDVDSSEKGTRCCLVVLTRLERI